MTNPVIQGEAFASLGWVGANGDLRPQPLGEYCGGVGAIVGDYQQPIPVPQLPPDTWDDRRQRDFFVVSGYQHADTSAVRLV
jgi:hypothetical protein